MSGKHHKLVLLSVQWHRLQLAVWQLQMLSVLLDMPVLAGLCLQQLGTRNVPFLTTEKIF